MTLAITVSLLFVIVSIILRYSIIQNASTKVKSSWISFILAACATTICTLISGGEQQSTLISGFATMLICYNILCR